MILFMILWKIYVEGIDLPNQTLTDTPDPFIQPRWFASSLHEKNTMDGEFIAIT